jgi:ATP-dependent Clp protease ATP-binding subunit ClpA
MFELLESDARRWVLSAAGDEARRRGDRRLGTDHLLLALLHDPKALAARTLGVDLDAARAAAEALDRAALRAIGVDLGEQSLPAPVGTRRRLAWTSGARSVFLLAVTEARRTKSRRISARHLLLAVLTLRRPDPAGELLDALGVDAARASADLRAADPPG